MAEFSGQAIEYCLILHVHGTEWSIGANLRGFMGPAPDPEELQVAIAPHIDGEVRIAWPLDIVRQIGPDRRYRLIAPSPNEIDVIMQTITAYMTERETGIVGAAALALIAMLQRQSLAVPRKMRLRLVLVSLLAITSWVALMGLALLWLDAREAAVLAISVPVWVALLAWPVLGERLSLVRALALMVALGGIFILIGGNSIEAGIGKLPGLLMALAGAICVGLGTVLTKHFPLAVPPLPLAGMG